MIAAITSLCVLTIVLGGGLALAQRRIRPVGPALVDAIDLLLPQTQCERCGYPGCRPYAEAVVSGTAINRCPPGGAATIESLAALLDRPAIPLDPELPSMDPNAHRIHRRVTLHRLRIVPACLSRRRDRRRVGSYAHRHHGGLHRLRTLSSGVSGRLHHDGDFADRSRRHRRRSRKCMAPPVRRTHPSGRRNERAQPRRAVSNVSRESAHNAIGTTRDRTSNDVGGHDDRAARADPRGGRADHAVRRRDSRERRRRTGDRCRRRSRRRPTARSIADRTAARR